MIVERRIPGLRARLIFTTVAVSCLFGCGGGGGGDNSGAVTPTSPTNGWTQGVFQLSSTFKNQCANPRTGLNASGQPFPDTQGSLLAENNWLRSWTNELYLWYDEVVDRNPANYSNTLTYFDLLKTTQTTATGAPKDKFHFTSPTDEWEAFTQSGVVAGYGATFMIISGQPPRELRIALVEPNSPAAAAGLLRGDEILSIDGVDAVNGNDVDTLNAGLLPAGIGETHTFQVRSAGVSRLVTLVSAEVESTPVHTVQVLSAPNGPVGYMLFNDHIATAEGQLIDAIETLRTADVADLVLDLRYNGGGYLAIASELAYMIAGPSRTAGKVFERMQWNNKHLTTNPVTGDPLAPTPFIDESVGFPPRAAGIALPTLDLPRVFVLTSADTCSASEAIMNGLRGVGVEVVQIGTTTCGKPYGFYSFDNCGTTYFSVQFKGVNELNFGEYTDGFSPMNTLQLPGTLIPGCSIADDLDHQLGDPNERMLSVALAYRTNNQCSLPPAAIGANKPTAPVEQPAIARSPYREIRIMSGRGTQ